eukprot:TRINITY_DN2586_c0_g1_i2.p1 TRINITY_DN2586_c0_g1~~TRINITY_DN2586_c0_g1_i2.p1  ORF type:complete len:667 (-),score=105.88 TRINITY_DN2586_c0_g1_i2:69-1997(-)
MAAVGMESRYRRSVFFCASTPYQLFVVLLIVMAAHPSAQHDNSNEWLDQIITYSTQPVNLYETFEISVLLDASRFASPFNDSEIYIDASIVLPISSHDTSTTALPTTTTTTTTTIVRQAFVTQNFTHNPSNWDNVTTTSPMYWMVRFAPRAKGSYAFVVTTRDPSHTNVSSTHTFSCNGVPTNQNSSHGFLNVPAHYQNTSHTNNTALHFMFEDGAPYYAIGENNCWGTQANYLSWWSNMTSVGATYSRLWLGGYSDFVLQDEMVGNYSLAAAHRLDLALEMASSFGIYVMLSLDTYSNYRTASFQPEWPFSPYNVINGGPCVTPNEYFYNDEAIELHRRFLRYMVARYASYTHVLSWEFFNEVDGVQNYTSEVLNVTQWHLMQGDYLRSVDNYYQHPRTTSFSQSPGTPAIDELSTMDYTQTHSYGSNDMAEMANYYCTYKVNAYHKPHIVAEFGVASDPTTTEAEDPTGLYVHNGVWSPLFNLCAGTSMTWWWDNWVAPQDLYWNWQGFQKFFFERMPSLSSAAQWSSLEDLETNTSGLDVWGVVGDNHTALIFVHNQQNNWARRYAGYGSVAIGPTAISFGGMVTGEYTLRFVNTTSGNVTDTLNVTVSGSDGDGDGGGAAVFVVPPVQYDVSLVMELM